MALPTHTIGLLVVPHFSSENIRKCIGLGVTWKSSSTIMVGCTGRNMLFLGCFLSSWVFLQFKFDVGAVSMVHIFLQ